MSAVTLGSSVLVGERDGSPVEAGESADDRRLGLLGVERQAVLLGHDHRAQADQPDRCVAMRDVAARHGLRGRAQARGGRRCALGVTSVPNAQTARRRKPRIGRKPSVLPCASATAPRQSTLSARSEGRTRNFRSSTVTTSGTSVQGRLTAVETPHGGRRREAGDVDARDLDARSAACSESLHTRRPQPRAGRPAGRRRPGRRGGPGAYAPAAFGAREAALDARRRSKTRPARTPDVSGGGTWKSRVAGSPTCLRRSASLSRRGTTSPRGDRP